MSHYGMLFPEFWGGDKQATTGCQCAAPVLEIRSPTKCAWCDGLVALSLRQLFIDFCLGDDFAPARWTDHSGVERSTPRTYGRLKFGKLAAHRALRAFVFVRDRFTCQCCGEAPLKVPADYNGEEGISLKRSWCLVMDHIRSRRNGGSNHPINLRTLCDACNRKKVAEIDVRHPAARLRAFKGTA